MKTGLTMGLVLLVLSGGWVAFAHAEPASDRLEVLGDRVNLRARPQADAEVAGQVSRGDILEPRGSTGEWVEVAVPENVGVWVASAFVQDGVASGDRVNVRAGAGLAYPAIGRLNRGDRVTERNRLGEWVEIAPPPDATLWVHRDYVRAMPFPVRPVSAPVESAPRAAPEPEPEPPPKLAPPAAVHVPVKAPAEPVKMAPAEPVLPLAVEPARPSRPAPVEPAVEEMEFEGVLRRASVMDWARLSDYAIMGHERGRPVTVCYVRGDPDQMKQFEGRRLAVRGVGYRLKEGVKPLVVIRQIRVLPDER